MIEDLKNIKSGKKELREFGLTIGIILAILGAVTLVRGKAPYPYLFSVGAIFLISGILFPIILRPIQRAWMGIAVIIGFFVSRIILLFIYYVILTPMGIAMRLLGRDILNQKIDVEKETYWLDRDETIKNKENYKKQY